MAKRRRSRPGRKGRKRPKAGEARRRRKDAGVHSAIFGAFLLSGFAGLMHQVVWAKLLVQLIGTTAHAQAAVLAVFMGGLALGSVLLGRRVDAIGRPLRAYILLEIAIGGYCLVLPALMHVAGLGYVALAPSLFGSPSLTFVLRFGLALCLVLAPAVLMGGTLPILARHLIGRVEETRRRVANLYALNSFGAVLGAGVAGFLTLPLLGVYPSLVLASLLNFLAALLVMRPSREEARHEARTAIAPERDGPSPYRTDQYAVTLLALAATGFAAMGYEVLFTRVISLSFGGTTYSFTVMLMCFISGIALGSVIVSRIRVERPLWVLGLSQLAVVVALLAVTPLVSRLPYLIGLLRIELGDTFLDFELYQLGKAALCLAVLLVPTTCLGFSFPLVAQVQARSGADIGRRVGSTYAWNTVGNVLGAVVTSLVLLPGLGLLGAFHFNFALNLMAGFGILLVAGEAPPWQRLAASAAVALAVVLYLGTSTTWLDPVSRSLNHLRMLEGPAPDASPEAQARHPSTSFEAWKARYVVGEQNSNKIIFAEDEHSTVLAYDKGREIVLYVNTKPDASTGVDLPTQVLLGQLPLFLALDARSLLVIGYGSGITAGSALLHPIERADIVEISRGVLDADPLFEESNYGVLSDPRVSIWREDGQSFLRAVPRSYDLIISEPSNPWIAGIAGLFTVEYFEQMRSKLAPGGVAAVWFHQYEQSSEGVELVLRTLLWVFPHVTLFTTTTRFADIIAVASNDPIHPDFAAMERRFDEPEIRNDLARIGISNLASLLFHHSASEERLRRSLPPGPLNTMGHPRLEYGAPLSFFRDEISQFVQRIDPIFQGERPGNDALLDRYSAWRTAVREPLRGEELATVMGRVTRRTAAALALRVEPATEQGVAPRRPSRGFVSDPEEMSVFEAAHWARAYTRSGHHEEAQPYLRRFRQLATEGDLARAGLTRE